MTNAKHTPGPWKAITYLTAVTTAWDVVDAQGQSVLSNDDDKANARLIAAAPELLEALQQAVFAMDSVFHITGQKAMFPYIEQTRAAIAKATGN